MENEIMNSYEVNGGRMKKVNFLNLGISLLALLITFSASGQDVFKINEKNSKVQITGTSSLHDWEMDVTGTMLEAGVKPGHDPIGEIQYIKFSAPVSKMESSSNIMDNKAHDALKEKKFPQIKFTLDEACAPIQIGKKSTIDGLLTIAGKTKKVKVPVDLKIVSARQFKASGKVSLKMSDFGIEPPTAIMGTLKTGDEVEVTFDFELNKVN